MFKPREADTAVGRTRMGEKSTYFTPEFFAFFRDLAKNNNKEWFTKSKERYEKAVQEPSLRFIRDAGAALQKVSSYLVADARPFGGSLSRIYRDIRFSPDKSPYKTEVGIHFWHAKASGPEHMAPGYYLHLASGESMTGSGVWHPEAPILKKIRDRIVQEPDAWKKVLRSRIPIEGESLKRPPPGYDPNHPFIQDLRRKDFTAIRTFRDNEITSPHFLESFVETCESMDPLNRFLADAIGLPW
jgi:uncharacterized protein (TIGR02453 family)